MTALQAVAYMKTLSLVEKRLTNHRSLRNSIFS